VKCEACGCTSLVASEPDLPVSGDVDARALERLVRMVVDAKRVPCELQGVARTTAGWRVIARMRQRDVVRIDLKATGLAAMRSELERALDAT